MMRNFQAALLLALCGVTPQSPETYAVAQAAWWSEFVRQMEAIGCVNIRHNLITDEFEFDCPEAKLEEAKRIVKRFKVRRA